MKGQADRQTDTHAYKPTDMHTLVSHIESIQFYTARAEPRATHSNMYPNIEIATNSQAHR